MQVGKKFGSQLRLGTHERLKAALEQDNSIVCNITEMDKHPGNTTAYLETLGLTKADLLRLERVGFAIRGYTHNHKVHPKGFVTYGKGHSPRWILLASKGTNVGKFQQVKGEEERVSTEGRVSEVGVHSGQSTE